LSPRVAVGGLRERERELYRSLSGRLSRLRDGLCVGELQRCNHRLLRLKRESTKRKREQQRVCTCPHDGRGARS
jgi:hypothetical protein